MTTIAAERPAGRCNRAAYWLFRAVFAPLIRAWFRLRVVGVERLPREGGFVIAANHTSFVDPLVLGAATPRRITYLMTILVFRSVWMGWFYRFHRAIPLETRGAGANRDAMRAARATLARGEVLGIFPEGGISRDGLPMLGNPGAVALGMSSDVPIVPVAIRGAFEAMPPGASWARPRRIEVVFGEPLRVESLTEGAARRDRLAVATDAIMQRITQLLRD